MAQKLAQIRYCIKRPSTALWQYFVRGEGIDGRHCQSAWKQAGYSITTYAKLYNYMQTPVLGNWGCGMEKTRKSWDGNLVCLSVYYKYVIGHDMATEQGKGSLKP